MSLGTHLWLIGSGAAGAAQALTSATDIHTFVIPERCVVVRAGFIVSSAAISSSVAAVLEFDRTPRIGGVREAAFAQITFPLTLGVGYGYWDQPATKKTLYAGDIVTVQVATASDSAGQGYPYLIVEPLPDAMANETAMTESA